MLIVFPLVLLVLGFLVGSAVVTAFKVHKAFATGKICYGQKEQTADQWRDVEREIEPRYFWEAVTMHLYLCTACAFGTLYVLYNLPRILRELM